MKRKHVIGIGAALAGTFLSVLLAFLVLRHLGAIVGALTGPSGGDIDFARIFEQTRNAVITPHWLVPLMYCTAFCAFTVSRPPRGWKIILRVLAGIFCFLLAFVTALLMTRVNAIRFADLLLALIPMLGAL